MYKDGNHKPEMAVALTSFEALCGFRPLEEIAIFLERVPQLKALVGDESVARFVAAVTSRDGTKDALRSVFTRLMTCPPDLVAKSLQEMLSDLANLDLAIEGSHSTMDLRELIKRLADEYPGDVGVFCVFFLNAMALAPGEAIFLGANEPHAYLRGDCVECMACSDNVVRAGLTPKYRDVDTLCSMLTYRANVPEVLKATDVDSQTVGYCPPVSEFYLTKTVLAGSGHDYPMTPCPGTSIVLCASGTGQLDSINVSAGTVIAIPPNHEPVISSSSDMTLFRCSENVYFGKPSP